MESDGKKTRSVRSVAITLIRIIIICAIILIIIDTAISINKKEIPRIQIYYYNIRYLIERTYSR